MNNIVCKKLSFLGYSIAIKSSFSEVFTFFNKMLNIKESEKETVDYFFEYRFINEMSNVIDEELLGTVMYELAAGKYYYDSKKNKYIIKFNNNNYGIWNFGAKKFVYYINKVTNLRSMFFLLFLDPLSISLLEYNQLIFHGALLKNIKNNKGLVIFGKSGYGKSSISNILYTKYDYYLLSDDVLFIKNVETLQAMGIDVGIGLTNDAVGHLSEENCAGIITGKKKYYFRKNKLDEDIITINDLVILKDKNYQNYSFECASEETFIKEMFEMQTNIPNLFLRNKLSAMRALCNNCNLYIVKYPEICDVDKLYSSLNNNGDIEK